MNGFDDAVLLFLNRFAQTSWTFDVLVDHVSRSNLLKGGVMIAVLWSLWFRKAETESSRTHIIATVVAALAAIAVARLLANQLPFRLRPIHNEALGLIIPYGTPETRLESWSAFPSDHAVLFFALATGIWFISRRLGLIMTVYVAIVIALPRLYLGLHYPTDIIAGGLIGAMLAIAANAAAVRQPMSKPALHWLRVSPATFYACFFLLSFQIAVLFSDGREFGKVLYGLILPHF